MRWCTGSKAFIAAAMGVILSLPPTALAAEKLKLSIPVLNATFAHFFVADEKGYFREEGIEPEFAALSGGVAIPALIGGSLGYTASPFAATNAILKGAELKVILVTAKKLTQQLWSFDTASRTIEDLKGQTVAIASRGGSEEVSIIMLLKSRNLPRDYLSFAAMGAGARRTAAIMAGSQKLATIGRIEQAQLEQSGFLKKGRMIFDFTKDFEIANGGLVTSDTEIAKNRDRAKRVLRALWKGTLYMQKQSEGTMAVLQKRFPTITRENLLEDLEESVGNLNTEGTLSAASAARELAIRGELTGIAPAKLPAVSKVYDFSLLEEVKQGLKAANWSPTR